MRMPNETIVRFEHDQGNWVPAPIRNEKLSFDASKYAEKKVVFLVRDPRDVLVSSWYHLKYRERIYRKDLSSFVREDLVGISKVIAFMNMWMANSNVPSDFLLLTYEQMQSHPIASFQRLLGFVGDSVEVEALEKAVEASSFGQMKRMESEGRLDEPWLRPGAGRSDDYMKIRKGSVGGFRQELSHEDLEFLDRIMRHDLSPELPYP